MAMWTPQADGASPVLMVRSLPPNTTERELIEWAEGFHYTLTDPITQQPVIHPARCEKALVLHDRQLGFVQFSDIWAARCIMSQFMYRPQTIFLQRGSERHLLNLVYSDKPEIRAQKNSASPPPPVSYPPNNNTSNYLLHHARLLLVVLKDVHHVPPSLDYLFWVFSQIAKVEKISTFTKDHKNQVVAQFETHEGATAAMAYLNGKELQGCSLAIVPSKLTQLTFRNADSRNRDYTAVNQDLESLIASGSGYPQEREYIMQRCVLHEVGAEWIPDFIWGEHRWGDGWLVPPQEPQYQGRIPPASASGVSAMQGKLGECMHVSGLPQDESVTAEHMWNICSMFGDVRAVKMLYKYPGCVVVQFAEVQACTDAIHHLNELVFRAKTWNAKVSRQPNASNWNNASTDLQKRMVTFMDPGRSQVPRDPKVKSSFPSRHVVLFGLPSHVTRYDIAGELERFNVNVNQVQMGEDEGTAHIELPSVDDGIEMAMQCNGKTVSSDRGEWRIQMRFADTGAPPNRGNLVFRPKNLTPEDQIRQLTEQQERLEQQLQQQQLQQKMLQEQLPYMVPPALPPNVPFQPTPPPQSITHTPPADLSPAITPQGEDHVLNDEILANVESVFRPEEPAKRSKGLPQGVVGLTRPETPDSSRDEESPHIIDQPRTTYVFLENRTWGTPKGTPAGTRHAQTPTFPDLQEAQAA